MSRTSHLPFGTKWVGCCSAYISKLQLTNKSISFKPEEFETLLFQTGCFAFRSPVKMDFVLRFNSSVISASLHALSGDLQIDVTSILVCPIGMLTPVASNESKGAGQHKYVGSPFCLQR
jgi:hypothetical protein